MLLPIFKPQKKRSQPTHRRRSFAPSVCGSDHIAPKQRLAHRLPTHRCFSTHTHLATDEVLVNTAHANRHVLQLLPLPHPSPVHTPSSTRNLLRSPAPAPSLPNARTHTHTHSMLTHIDRHTHTQSCASQHPVSWPLREATYSKGHTRHAVMTNKRGPAPPVLPVVRACSPSLSCECARAHQTYTLMHKAADLDTMCPRIHSFQL